MKKSDEVYDIAIIGGGLAGLQLLHALLSDDQLKNQKIILLEKDDKIENDKSWSFWEQGSGKWDDIVHKSWTFAEFNSNSFNKKYDLSPYKYKMIRSADFYAFIKKKLEAQSNVLWQKDQIKDVEFGNIYNCIGKNSTYFAKKVFDSRLTDDYQNSEYPFVLQHFKGWFIESKKEVFDNSCFQMMDFRNEHIKDCAFTYVLPFSSTKALVEYTFFSPKLVKEGIYEQGIKNYINQHLKIKDYKVFETEAGVIPMSAHPFHLGNQENYIKIGTAGGWVKASSGYSFKNTSNKIEQLILNLKNNLPLDHQLFKKRFSFYDKVFLSVLQNENHLGAKLFEEMYSKNSIQSIFRFLDEKSNLMEELKIISRFSKAPFLRALWRVGL